MDSIRTRRPFLTLFLLGCLFTLARELTGSLWVAVAMHAIQNTMVTAMMFLALNGFIPEDQMPEDLKEIFEQKEQPAMILRAPEIFTEAGRGAHSS